MNGGSRKPTDDQQSVSNQADLCIGHGPATGESSIKWIDARWHQLYSTFTLQSSPYGLTVEMSVNHASPSLLWVGVEWRSSSPLLQYCSSRLVLSYRLPHEATRSDILPDLLLLPAFFLPLHRRTPLVLRSPPSRSPLHASPTFTGRQTHLHLPAPAPLLLSRSCVVVSVKRVATWKFLLPPIAFKIRQMAKNRCQISLLRDNIWD